jgi:polyisoprenoid-binding protein YceI
LNPQQLFDQLSRLNRPPQEIAMTTPTLNVRDYNGATIPAVGTFVIDSAHTEVAAVVRHLMVSKVRGSFTGVTGTVTIAEDPTQSSVVASIPAASINTGVVDRDNHLRGPDFLDVQTYPTLEFRSTGLAHRRGSTFVLRGELTIHGVTREVELDLDLDGVALSPFGKEIIAFTARTEFDRDDFGISWNVALETGGVLVSKKVVVEISAQAAREV